MKKYKPIYKTWNLYSLDEQKDIMAEYEEDLPEDQKFELAAEDINGYGWECLFGKDGDIPFSNLADQEVVITGTLGLWDGRHKIKPVKVANIIEAVNKCCNQDIEVVDMYEDSYGNFILDAYHHDGCNHFVIKKYTDKGIRCLHFIREVYGA